MVMKYKKYLFTYLLVLLFPMQATAGKSEIFSEHIVLGDYATLYSVKSINNNVVEIHAEGRNSSSSLYTKMPSHFLDDTRKFSWSWKVNDIQKSSNIYIKEKEDFAASIVFVFGKSNVFSKPKVLSYAWVGNDILQGSIVKSPRAPDHFRTLILNNINTDLKVWKHHNRDILNDFKLAYGHYPDETLTSIGVLTDNDQTLEKVSSEYKLYRGSRKF